jgi:hypothetical protein
MLNVHESFLLFEKQISLPEPKKKKLIASRKALQKRIEDYFRLNTNLPIPKFYIQGSYKMGTIVVDKKGTYDIDLGVYFLTKPNIESFSLQQNVLRAAKGHTVTGTQHRDKCIRVVYKGDFDIDLPVYYKSPQDRNPYLATKNGWLKSDPKELCDWFESKKDKNGQLVRLVKYFKYWASRKTKKMPSGISFSVWVANHYKPNIREDISFYETAKAIKSHLWWSWSTKCTNPATPYDNFLAKLTEDQIKNFTNELEMLVDSSKHASIEGDNQKAAKIWRKVFGSGFPA